MSELIGELDEGGSTRHIPDDWAAGERTRPYDHDTRGVVAALVACALSGAVTGGAIGFVLGWLLT